MNLQRKQENLLTRLNLRIRICSSGLINIKQNITMVTRKGKFSIYLVQRITLV
jgi:hypothetical protein